ncbi:coenzyme Q-binding protein COQ10 homolog A, mitochondrial [Ciona intestinalis]
MFSVLKVCHRTLWAPPMQCRAIGSAFSRTLRHNDRKVMNIPVEVMYNVVADVEKYVDFVPWCSKSIVRSKTENSANAKLVVGFGPVKEHYNSRLIFKQSKFVKAICTEGRLFNLLDCTWKFYPGNSPSSCIVDFNVVFEFRSLIYSRLATMFFNEVVLKMVSAFETQAIKQHRKILLKQI